MAFNRFISRAAAASAIALLPAGTAFAADLVYGNWTPAQEYQNRVVMPELFRNIEKDTNGAIKWKLIAGGQIADGKTTFTAVKDGLMQAGLGIVTYVPNAIPSVYAIYSTIIFGENDPVAASAGRAGDDLSQLPVLPRGVQEASIPSRWAAGPARPMCWPAASRCATTGRPQGQARARHRRQRRNAQDGRHGAGRCHAGRGGRPVAARRPRLPARHPSIGCAPSATATSPNTSWTIRSA